MDTRSQGLRQGGDQSELSKQFAYSCICSFSLSTAHWAYYDYELVVVCSLDVEFSLSKPKLTSFVSTAEHSELPDK